MCSWDSHRSFLLARDRPVARRPVRRWLHKCMPYAQIVQINYNVLADSGLDCVAAQQRTYNTLRRFLPTAANIFQLPQSVCQAVGSWEEVPQGEGGSVGHATRPMSVHYSAELALASGKAKADAFVNFQHLIILVACET